MSLEGGDSAGRCRSEGDGRLNGVTAAIQTDDDLGAGLRTAATRSAEVAIADPSSEVTTSPGSMPASAPGLPASTSTTWAPSAAPASTSAAPTPR